MIQLAEQYISDVLEGRQMVGRKARLAVERHVSDMQIAETKGWYFDKVEAEIALTFIGFLRHTKGEFARKNFRLQPFQAFIIYSLFGWRLKGSGLRRFRKAYVRMARKNGKSELAAAIGLYMLVADGEPGAEVYSAATIRDQAKKVFDPAAVMMRMLKKEDRDINKASKVFDSKNNCVISLVDGDISNTFTPLSMDADTSEGSSPHLGIVDEYHLHKNSKVVDMLETGMGGRRQPMLLIITTAGFDMSLPCYAYELVVVRVLQGDATLDGTFVMIFDLDEEDDWKDESLFEKANPGVSAGFPTIEYLRDEMQKALVEGFSKEKAFRVKNCNQWLSQAVGWIPEDFWRAAKRDFSLEEMRGRRCYVGFDYARVRDLVSLCFLFPPEAEGEKFRFFWRHFCPGDTIDDPKRNEGKIAYKNWEAAGLLTRTDGNVIDEKVMFDTILYLDEMLDIRAIGYDRRFAYALIADLKTEGMEVMPIAQNSQTLTVPIYQTEALFYGGHAEIQDNPLMSWQMGNVVLIYEDGDHVRTSKKKSPEKIDGVAAMLDALAVYMQEYNEEEAVNIYDLLGLKLLVK